MAAISVASRFNGPPTSGNGGYGAGLIAAEIGASVAVRLHAPIPLHTSLHISESDGHRWEVRADDAVIATAFDAHIDLEVPQPPSYTAALEASKHYVGFNQHAFSHCFVCGPQRKRNDGLCVFPGTLAGTQVLAAPWLPDTTLDNGDGKVRPEFIWAALDCPGYFATAHPAAALLGEIAVHIDRLVHIDEPCVVIAWAIARDGRKHRAGTALFDEDGERCAVGIATWIELKKE